MRHLEFRTADVLKKGADTLIVTNVAQSNHARLHTAVAAKFGLTNYIIKIPSKKDQPIQGNLLLDHIMGARIIEAESDDHAAIERQLDELIAELTGGWACAVRRAARSILENRRDVRLRACGSGNPRTT